MKVERLVLGELETNCWLVGPEGAGPWIVIDPAGDARELLEALSGRPVAAVVLTHGHFDHLGAATALIEATAAPLAVHSFDAGRITDPVLTGGRMFGFEQTAPEPSRLLEDGDVIETGPLRLEVMHTPGHSPGSICLLGAASPGGQERLFSGDTLFAGSVGRTDFPGGDARALRSSIGERLASLADDTLVHPGHGPDTTIGRERRVNPFFPRA